MKIQDWLKQHEMSIADFARSIGVPHSTIYRIITECRPPSASVMEKIHAGTNGAVEPNDFFALKQAG